MASAPSASRARALRSCARIVSSPNHVRYDLSVVAILDQDAVLAMDDQLVDRADSGGDRDAAELLRLGDHQRRPFPARRHQQDIGPGEMFGNVLAAEDRRRTSTPSSFSRGCPG